MTISDSVKRQLFTVSGNRCAFPTCTKTLTLEDEFGGKSVSISQIAHIVAKSPEGPRGKYPLPEDVRDSFENLILLCQEHHTLVDSHPETYPVEMLRKWKADHEELVTKASGDAVAIRSRIVNRAAYVEEEVHSSLLPVIQLPMYIFSAPLLKPNSRPNTINGMVHYPKDGAVTPFILRENRLYCFADLRQHNGPFRDVIQVDRDIDRIKANEWWQDDDRHRWYIDLLNRSLNKLTGRKGLNWDRQHKRYYFHPSRPGESISISYQPLNQSRTTRQVVWNPKSRKYGTARSYWFHLAVSLRFHHVADMQWCLSVRPEMHLTKDGVTPYPSERRGSKITKKKSRRFNYDFLSEIQFWRDFLSDGRPRITLRFDDNQYLSISNQLMTSMISWPGTPPEHFRPFTNTHRAEDLFSIAELDALEEAMQDTDSGEDDDGDSEDWADEWGNHEDE